MVVLEEQDNRFEISNRGRGLADFCAFGLQVKYIRGDFLLVWGGYCTLISDLFITILCKGNRAKDVFI